MRRAAWRNCAGRGCRRSRHPALGISLRIVVSSLSMLLAAVEEAAVDKARRLVLRVLEAVEAVAGFARGGCFSRLIFLRVSRSLLDRRPARLAAVRRQMGQTGAAAETVRLGLTLLDTVVVVGLAVKAAPAARAVAVEVELLLEQTTPARLPSTAAMLC